MRKFLVNGKAFTSVDVIALAKYYYHNSEVVDEIDLDDIENAIAFVKRADDVVEVRDEVSMITLKLTQAELVLLERILDDRRQVEMDVTDPKEAEEWINISNLHGLLKWYKERMAN